MGHGFSGWRGTADLDRLQSENSTAGDRLRVFSADVTDRELRAALIAQEVPRHLGGLDLRVNNAGTTFGGLAADSPLEEFRRVLELNLMAVFDLCQRSHPLLKASGRGNIVNISSVASLNALPLRTFLRSEQGGVEHMTMSLATEWGPGQHPSERRAALVYPDLHDADRL